MNIESGLNTAIAIAFQSLCAHSESVAAIAHRLAESATQKICNGNSTPSLWTDQPGSARERIALNRSDKKGIEIALAFTLLNRDEKSFRARADVIKCADDLTGCVLNTKA